MFHVGNRVGAYYVYLIQMFEKFDIVESHDRQSGSYHNNRKNVGDRLDFFWFYNKSEGDKTYQENDGAGLPGFEVGKFHD